MSLKLIRETASAVVLGTSKLMDGFVVCSYNLNMLVTLISSPFKLESSFRGKNSIWETVPFNKASSSSRG